MSKFCPLRMIAYSTEPAEQVCLENECAWFIEETGYCSLVYLHTMSLELWEIRTRITSDKRSKEEKQ